MSDPIPLTLVLTDENNDVELVEELTQQYYDQLSDTIGDLVEDVVRVAADSQDQIGTPKGTSKQTSGLLKLEVNLENLVKFGKWLHEKLTGKSVKVSLKVTDGGGIEYEIDGIGQRDVQAVMQEMQAFVERKASSQASNLD